MKKRTVTVNDTMQRGYRYQLVEPAGRNFDPEFHPGLTPKQVLQLGVFGGKYMTDARAEFPNSWFAGAKLSTAGRDSSLITSASMRSEILHDAHCMLEYPTRAVHRYRWTRQLKSEVG